MDFNREGEVTLNERPKCQLSLQRGELRIIVNLKDGRRDEYVSRNGLPQQILFADGERVSFRYTENLGKPFVQAREFWASDGNITNRLLFKYDQSGFLSEADRGNSRAAYKWIADQRGATAVSIDYWPDGLTATSKTRFDLRGRVVVSEQHNSKPGTRVVEECRYEDDFRGNWLVKNCKQNSYYPDGRIETWSSSLTSSETRVIDYYE